MMFWFNRHRRLRDQLSAYIDGELDASAAERLERHLAECGRCRQEMEQLRATVAALQELPAVEPPRSFTLSPERVAPRPPMPVASPLAFGARIAAAGVAAALAVVLIVDLGDFGGDGVTDDATAPQMMRSEADEEESEAAGGAPAAEDEEETFMGDAETDQVEEPPPTEGGQETPAAAPSPMPTVPPDMTAVPRGEEPAPAPGGLTPQPEAGIIEAAPAAQGGGGIDALTAVEIGLAFALGLLVAGSLFLAFAGRRR
jgi:hypothetical protein